MLIRCQMQRSSPGDEGLFITLKSARKNKKIISQMRWSLDFKASHARGTILPADTSRDLHGDLDRLVVVMFQESQYHQSRHELLPQHSLSGAGISSFSPATTTTSLPEFVRLPKAGSRCHWTGLSRSALCELILPARAPVKSVVLKRRGAKRGIRLIHLPSLIAYLHTQTIPDAPLPPCALSHTFDSSHVSRTTL